MEQRPHMDGYTVGLEVRWFLTYAGELIYHYSCRPIFVVGRDDTSCYSALPINLVVEDQKRIAANRGDDKTNGTTGFAAHSAGYFLEPHTRILTFWGTHMPCVQNFGAAYLNTPGGWVVALPHLLLTEAPQTLKQHENLEYTQGQLMVYDIRDGGIYEESLVRAMEQFSQTRRLRSDVGTVLAVQGQRFANPSHISPHDLWQEIPLVSFDFLGWLGDLLDQWGTVLAAVTLLLVCFKALSFISGLHARCLAAHRIWGCKFHLLAAILPSVLQWMAIQLGLRGVWPAIEGEDPANHEVESFLTHAHRSVMRDRLDKKDHKRKDSYHSCSSLVKLGTLEAKRKDLTGCNSVIVVHEPESFRIPDSFKVMSMASPLSPAAFHRQQLAQVHNERKSSAATFPVCHPMYVAGNQRLPDLRAALALGGGEDHRAGLALGVGELVNPLYPNVDQELVTEEVPNAPEGADSEGSGDYDNQHLGCH
jgi:hypothetical protein